MGWIYTANGKTHGPMSAVQLRFDIKSGSVPADARLKAEGADDWMDVDQALPLLSEPQDAATAAAPQTDTAISNDDALNSAKHSLLWLLAIGCLIPGLNYLFNPSVPVEKTTYAIASDIVNYHRLTLGAVFSIVGAIFLNGAIAFRSK